MKIMRSAIVSGLLLASLFFANLLFTSALLDSIHAQEAKPTGFTPAGAGDTPLSVVLVSAPEINCIFTTSVPCVTPVLGDGLSKIPLAGTNSEAKLQMRQIPQGETGAAAEDLYPYLYRFNFFGAEITTPPAECVTSLTIEFGPIEQVDYDEDGTPDDIYVVHSGGSGAVGLSGAVQTASGAIVMTLAEPLCPETELAGHGSYFFGIASALPPFRTNATVGASGGAAYVLSSYAPERARVFLPVVARE